MGAEEHDIVARVSRSTGATSTGALAAHLGQACGHVLVDARVIQQGYRFHAELSEDIPAFFNRRISTGSTNLAITLQAGFDPAAAAPAPFDPSARWATDPFEGCTSTQDARRIVEADDYHASMWLARITVGVQMMDVREVSDPLFIARHPNEFRAIAEELVSLGVMPSHGCPLCGTGDDD